jgi:hypothetical protein
MVPGQRLSIPEIAPVTAAVLAAVSIPGEEERVGYLSTEASRHVHVANETDHHGRRIASGLGSEGPILVHFQGFRLPVDHEAEGPAYRDYGQRLEGRV